MLRVRSINLLGFFFTGEDDLHLFPRNNHYIKDSAVFPKKPRLFSIQNLTVYKQQTKVTKIRTSSLTKESAQKLAYFKFTPVKLRIYQAATLY